MKLTRDQCLEIYKRWQTRMSYKSLAVEYGVSRRTIQAACNERGKALIKKERARMFPRVP